MKYTHKKKEQFDTGRIINKRSKTKIYKKLVIQKTQ